MTAADSIRAWGEMAKACAEAVATAREKGVEPNQIDCTMQTLGLLGSYNDVDDNDDDGDHEDGEDEPDPDPSKEIEFSVN